MQIIIESQTHSPVHIRSSSNSAQAESEHALNVGELIVGIRYVGQYLKYNAFHEYTARVEAALDIAYAAALGVREGRPYNLNLLF